MAPYLGFSTEKAGLNSMPPRAPQTTRNIVKINNFMAGPQSSKKDDSAKPLKFNFKLNASSGNTTGKRSNRSDNKVASMQNQAQDTSSVADQNSYCTEVVT